jgi:hypothetical protein
LDGVRRIEFGVRVAVRRVSLEGCLPVLGGVLRQDVVTRVALGAVRVLKVIVRVLKVIVRVLKVIVRDRVANRPGGDGQAREQQDQSGAARRRSDCHPVTLPLLPRNWKQDSEQRIHPSRSPIEVSMISDPSVHETDPAVHDGVQRAVQR